MKVTFESVEKVTLLELFPGAGASVRIFLQRTFCFRGAIHRIRRRHRACTPTHPLGVQGGQRSPVRAQWTLHPGTLDLAPTPRRECSTRGCQDSTPGTGDDNNAGSALAACCANRNWGRQRLISDCGTVLWLTGLGPMSNGSFLGWIHCKSLCAVSPTGAGKQLA
jgi:hypothetical protein